MVNVNQFCQFIEYAKAFDTVQLYILFKIVRERDLIDKDSRLEQDLSFKETAAIRLENDLSCNVYVPMKLVFVKTTSFLWISSNCSLN